MSDVIVQVRFHKRYQIWNQGEVAGFPPHMIATLVPTVASLHKPGVVEAEAPAEPSAPAAPAGGPAAPVVASLAGVVKQG